MSKKKQQKVLQSLTLTFKLAHVWENFLDQYLKSTNITIKQFLLLLTIRDKFDNNPAISDLAVETESSHQNIKQIALQLKNKNFVQFKKDPTDKRYLRIIITNAGNKFIEMHMNEITTQFTKIFKKEKSKDVQKLNELLTELIGQSKKRLIRISE